MARDPKKSGEAQVLEGKDLKTSMKKLSKGPMRFAFGFKDRQKPILLMHKTKSSRALHNELKTKMGAKTATHGMASADGNALVMDVEGPPIPSMDKMVKVLLRKEKVDKYKEARVRMLADIAPDLDGKGDGASGTDVAAAALIAKLQGMQGEIQALEPIAGELLKRIAAGDDVDRTPMTDYVKLCAAFGKTARGCGDAELLEFGKNRLGRAKKMSGLMQRFAAAPKDAAGGAGGSGDAATSGKGAPATPAVSDLSGPVGKGGRNAAEDVTSVQSLLNKNGASLDVDGKCGPKTIAAIAKFQKEKLGFSDGRVDPGGKTWAALTGGAPSSPGGGAPGATGTPGASGPSATGSTGAGGDASAGASAGKAGGAVDSTTKQSAKKKDSSGKQVPDGAEVEVGWGDRSIGLKKSEDGTTLTIKESRGLPIFATNFMVWVIPCYTKAGVKAELSGSITIGKKTGGGLQATGSGTFELGIGGTGGGITAGPYGSVSLSASNSCSVSYSEKDGLDVQPFTFELKGSGKVGIKVEIDDGPTADVSQEVFDWQLFVVHVGRYANDKFEYVEVKAGKDLKRLIAALEAGGPKIEAFVEEYAPEAVKQAAKDGAIWVAESETAGDIQEVVQDTVDYIEEKTGVDVGGTAEEIVQTLVDPDGETSDEATERVNKEAEAFNASQDDFHAVIDASGLKGDLRPFRTSDEYNAIVDVWQAETELTIKGKKAPGKWRTMVEQLVAKARKRKSQQKANEQAKKKEEDSAVQQAVAAMEAARPAAQGPGNVLNNKLQQTPNAEAKQFFDKGWQSWNAAEQTRKQALSLQGAAKAQKASEAKALYEQARATFQTGLQYL